MDRTYVVREGERQSSAHARNQETTMKSEREDLHMFESRWTFTLTRQDFSNLAPRPRFLSIVSPLVVAVLLSRLSIPPRLPRCSSYTSSHEVRQADQELVRVESVGVDLELASLESSGFRSCDEDFRIENGFSGSLYLVERPVTPVEDVSESFHRRIRQVGAET